MQKAVTGAKSAFALIAAIVLALTLCMLSACSGGNNAKKGVSVTGNSNEVVVAIGSEPEAGFDPMMNWGSGEHAHEPLIQSTLVRTDKDLNFQNDLATDYKVSDDGLTWTFTIRDDVKFTDGESLTASDVAFTINELKASEIAETDFSMIDNAEATDDTTVEIHMNKPYNALLYWLANIGIVPEHAYDENYGANPVGSGRYMLEQWDRGQQAILVANPDYYGEKPNIERVVVLFMDDDAALAAAKAGEVDVAQTNATLANNAPDGYEVFVCESVDSRGLSLPTLTPGQTVETDGQTYNAGNAVTSNLEVRQAINYGIDRQRFVDNVLNGYGTLAYSVGTDMPWYSEDMVAEYDPEAAQKFLTDAGWEKGEDGIYVKDGQRCAFDIYYNSADSVRQAIALEFVNQMKEIGIEVTATGAGWDDLYPHQYSDPIVWGFGCNAPYEIYSLYHTNGGFNVAGYSNTKVDEYIDAALATPTVEESFDLWKKAQWDGETGIAPKGDAPWVWIANIDHLYFAKDGLKIADQKPHPHGHGWSLLNNVDEWSWNA